METGGQRSLEVKQYCLKHNIYFDGKYCPMCIEPNEELEGKCKCSSSYSRCNYCDDPVTKSNIKQKKIKSDGGSSGYYEYWQPIEIDGEVHQFLMETRDFIRYGLDNDFDLGNIAKAIKRIAAAKAGGGKEGASIEHDLNKIIYTAELLKILMVKS